MRHRRSANATGRQSRWSRWAAAAMLLLLGLSGITVWAQAGGNVAPSMAAAGEARARRFAAERRLPGGASAAAALAGASAERQEELGSLRPATRVAGAGARVVSPAGLTAAWTPAGPGAIASLQYGYVSGRVTAVAVDPNDLSGNTVFVGTTGGGVWRSTNAAGAASAVQFSPMTDTLPVFSASAGSSVSASLSIGAVIALPGGVVLAGTGDPNDATDSFYGSGLLRSVDDGLTWSLVTGSRDGVAGNHSFAGLGFAGFASPVTNPSLVVAAVSASAEGAVVNAGNSASVMGLYYSTDAGATWQMATLLDGAQTVQAPSPAANVAGNAATSVVWNPVRQRFYAAVRSHGYYQSADGMTWTRLAAQPGTGLTATACPVVTSARCPIFRGALAVNAVTGDTFALTADSSNGDGGLYQDVCAATGSTGCATGAPVFATQIATGALHAVGTTQIPQADYNLSLAAMPLAAGPNRAGDTVLFVGTSDLFRCSLQNGCVLRNTTNTANGCTTPARVAPAQHALAVDGGTAVPMLLLGNDGGVWRSTDTVNEQATPCSQDDQTHFDNLNLGLGSLAEVVSAAEDPLDPAVLLEGLGALGTVSTGRADQTAWQQISAGEGGSVAIDATNPALWYMSTAAGVAVGNCALGAACGVADVVTAVTATGQMAGDVAGLDAPWLLDPGAPANVLAGTCRVWRGPAAQGALWSGSNALSAIFAGPQGAACGAINGLVAAVGAGGGTASGLTTAGSTVVYAGMAGAQVGGGGAASGHVFVTTAANLAGPGTAWADVSGNVTNDVANAGTFNPARFSVSSVTVDAHDATGRTVYATVEGFSGNGLSVPHVYRSTDAGAHWTNISGNLPNAPANALLVDPNDANTVYVAMDAGVYVTTAVTTCATANCWSVMGTSLPNAPVTTLMAAAGMPTGDGRLGMLRAGTYGRGLWQTPLLTAQTLLQPAMTLSVPNLSFGTQAVGTGSVAQTVVVTNTGSAALQVSQVVVLSGNAATGTQGAVTDFVATGSSVLSCTRAALAVGATCALQVSFVPSAVGQRVATLVVYGNVPGGQVTVGLTGVAVPPPALAVTPTNLVFPSTDVAGTSAAETVSVANTGGTALTLSPVAVAGTDFQVLANTCGTTLAAGTACAVSVRFQPGAAGQRSGTLTVLASSGSGSSLGQVVQLAGVATAPPTDSLSGTALSFATTTVGTASGVQQVTLTNAGDRALTLIAASVSTGEFAVVNGCGSSLSGHAACALQVSFTPHTVGTATAALTVGDVYRSQTVVLTGTAVAPPGISLLPAGTMQFPATGLGVQSAAQVLTLTNNGGEPLLISSITPTGDFAMAAAGSTCGAVLAPGRACGLAVVFAPGTTGARTGSLTVVDNAASSPQTVQLAGTGVDFSLASNGVAGTGGGALTLSGAGAHGSVALLLSSPAGLTGTASLQCVGLPLNATCSLSPSTVALGGTTAVTVTLATAAVASSSSAMVRMGAGVVLALLLPVGLAVVGRGSVPRLLVLLVAVLGLSGLNGCGGTPRQIPGAGETSTGQGAAVGAPTPAGVYNVTVTATAAGLTRSTVVTLTVQ